MATRLHEVRPDARLTWLEGVGHYPMLEAPSAFLDAVGPALAVTGSAELTGARRQPSSGGRGSRHMGHTVGPPGRAISPVTSKRWRR